MSTTRIVDDGGHEARSIFDAADNLIGSVDSAALLTRYAYDDDGNVTAVLDPVGHKTAFAYDQDQNLTGITNLKGDTSSMTYDPSGRPATIGAPTGEATTITYRADGQVDTVTDDTGATTRYDYDDYGRLVAEHRDLDNATLSYRYDMLGRRSTLELHRGPILAARNAYSYDASGRVTQLIDSTGGESNFDYDPVGRLASIGHANGSVTRYTYDPAGQITQLLNLPEALVDLQGDADTPLQAATDTLAGLHTVVNDLSEPANVTAVEDIVTELQELIANLAGGGADVPTMVQLLGDLADTTDALDATIAELIDPETLTALETLVADLGETLASLPNSVQADQATDLVEDLAALTSELTGTVTGLSNEIDLIGDLLANVLRLARAIVNSESGETELTATLDTVDSPPPRHRPTRRSRSCAPMPATWSKPTSSSASSEPPWASQGLRATGSGRRGLGVDGASLGITVGMAGRC